MHSPDLPLSPVAHSQSRRAGSPAAHPQQHPARGRTLHTLPPRTAEASCSTVLVPKEAKDTSDNKSQRQSQGVHSNKATATLGTARDTQEPLVLPGL